MSAGRADRSSQCDGKVKHPDRRAARRARQQTTVDGPGHFTIYRCPWCRQFHIGHARHDPYVDDMELRRELRRRELELANLDLVAAEAVAPLLGVSVDEALELLVGDASREYSATDDDEASA